MNRTYWRYIVMAYSEEDRKNVLERSENKENKRQCVNLAFAYSMYDIMRLQLEELHRIGDTMESILSIIQQEQKNQ